MILNDIWFVLFVVIISGYLILDGFDMGIGILHPFMAKNDKERRTMLNSIGPVWDGNEVWIILGGGALFAAFPFVYASLFSGFYAAMMLVLLVMILRTVAIEVRSKEQSARWRSLWDIVFAVASLLLALLLGVAFGNIINGVPIDANGDMWITLIGLLRPFPLLVGLTTVAMLAAHGALYAELRTEGKLQERIKKGIPTLWLVFTILIALTVLATVLFLPHLTSNYQNNLWPVIFALAAVAALFLVWRMIRAGRYLAAFVASSAVIALSVISAAAGMFPNLLVSSTDPAFNLTIYNAASESNTLTVMLVIALIGMPLVLVYQAAVYYIFRGKTTIDTRSY
jgi:cytochrome d ubiquinol oxidase subunit II